MALIKVLRMALIQVFKKTKITATRFYEGGNGMIKTKSKLGAIFFSSIAALTYCVAMRQPDRHQRQRAVSDPHYGT